MIKINLCILMVILMTNIFPISGQLRDGLYAIRNTISVGQGGGQGKGQQRPPTTTTSYLESLSPKSPKEFSLVVARDYSRLPGAQWIIKRVGQSSSLSPQGNQRNFLTGQGYQFRFAQNATFLIERTYAQGNTRTVQCLKNNGPGRYVGFENCGPQVIYPSSPFRWEFCPILGSPGGRGNTQG